MSQRKWPSWAGPALLGGLIIILAIVALIREPVELDPDTPEGIVQQYLQAVSNEDYELAIGFLDPDLYQDCEGSDLERYGPEQFTATIDDTNVSTTSRHSEVTVSMEFGSGGPFGGGWSSQEVFRLTASEGSWFITDEPWPYIFWECKEGI